MLKTFYVDNFKSHINTTYKPGPVNLLIGMNNSGKTNLCQALRFVGLTSRLAPSSGNGSVIFGFSVGVTLRCRGMGEVG